ncbi:MAG: PA domain-containing protein, partial [Thermoanaerobaculia bacterium]|nr:PA domain-containing protein [Thermoanaerobaculia bacterium]
NTWYVGALANKLFGQDRFDGDAVIGAQFNSALNGDPGCLGGFSWYYGLDNNPGANQTDLVVVVLHELGHGLGFLTLADKEDGRFLVGLPDAYSRFLFDATLGQTWPQMTAQQRAASVTNTDNLLWIGDNVTAAAPSFLGPTPILEIQTPESIEGTYDIGLAQFGADITVAGVTATVVAAEDAANDTGPSETDACTAITNPSEIAGHIALIDRGDCTFVSKTRNAQDAGAVGVIIVNNVAGAPPGMAGDDPTLTIPVVSVSLNDGSAIRGALGEGVIASIRLDSQNLAGTDSLGRVRMYAPPELAEGSSVSHWDTSAEPDLLMEPNISSSLGHGVDLSRDLFADIGWFSNATVEATLRAILAIDQDRDGAIDPGDTVRMISSIQNNSDSAGQEMVFDLALATGLTLISDSVSGGAVIDDVGRVAVEIGTLNVGAEATVIFDLQIDSSLSSSVTTLSLQGAITGSNVDTAVTDDPSTTETDDPTVIEISQTPLRAFKSVLLIDDVDENAVLSEGDRLRYQVRLENHSVVAVSDVTFEDTLDSSVEIVPGSVSVPSGSVVEGNDASDRMIVVNFDSIPASAEVEFTFDVVVLSGLAEGVKAIVNQGTATAPGLEALVTDDPDTLTLFDPTIIRFPDPRLRPVRRP